MPGNKNRPGWYLHYVQQLVVSIITRVAIYSESAANLLAKIAATRPPPAIRSEAFTAPVPNERRYPIDMAIF
jgi:hypothetical protein